MLKTLKPDHYYIIVNLDEPYARDIYEVLKYGQTQKGEWLEGDVSFEEWVDETWFPAGEADHEAAMTMARAGDLDRARFSLVEHLLAERDALAQQVERLRRVEKAVDKAIGACIFRDDPDRDELACDECPWREVCFVLAKEATHE